MDLMMEPPVEEVEENVLEPEDLETVSTLMCRIDVQLEINVKMEKFLENNKRAGRNRRAVLFRFF